MMLARAPLLSDGNKCVKQIVFANKSANMSIYALPVRH